MTSGHRRHHIDPAVDVRVPGEPLGGAHQQRAGPAGVAALQVDACDRDLDHALPQIGVLERRGVPDVLETLVRLEVTLLAPESDPERQGVLDVGGIVLLGQRDPGGAIGQRPAGAIAWPRLLRSAIVASVPGLLG